MSRERVIIRERLHSYTEAEHDAWMAGDKSILPPFIKRYQSFFNQQNYGLGEAISMRWFHQNEGWLGYMHYSLTNDRPRGPRRAEGTKVVDEFLPSDKLAALRALRAKEQRRGGEPDLFLYKPTGEFMFVEAKRTSTRDEMDDAQFRYIAQIMSILECRVEITRVAPLGARADLKVYGFDLVNFSGLQITAD